MKIFGEKKEKELIGSNLILKLKMLNTAKMMLKLNGITMVLLMLHTTVLIDI